MMTCLKYFLPISCVLLVGVCLWLLLVPAKVTLGGAVRSRGGCAAFALGVGASLFRVPKGAEARAAATGRVGAAMTGGPTPPALPEGKGEKTLHAPATVRARVAFLPLPFREGGRGGRFFFAIALLWALVLPPARSASVPDAVRALLRSPRRTPAGKLFLNREWRATAKLPLWNPHHFCGAPFVHDPQVGTFYPPNLVVLLVPESAVGAVTSWVIALHVLAAGLFALLYARSHGAERTRGPRRCRRVHAVVEVADAPPSRRAQRDGRPRVAPAPPVPR